jgi:transcriptional regulator with XRE-family HTH domain
MVSELVRHAVAESLGERVRRLRTGARIGTRDLSRRIDQSESYISKIESGEIRVLAPDVAGRIAHELGTTAAVILGVDESRPMAFHDQLRWLTETAPVDVPVVRTLARAGSGGMIPPDEIVDFIPMGVEYRGRLLAWVIVSGECMEPELSPGDKVLVDLDLKPHDGELAVVLHEGETLVKYVVQAAPGQWELHSEREGSIPVGDETAVLGKVIDTMRKPPRRRPRRNGG